MALSINNATDQVLISKCELLSKKESEVTATFLVHILEFDRRKLYLDLGYSSLYAWMTEHLKYSEPAAMRRIKAARLLGFYPELYEVLIKREVSLTTLHLISPVVTPENKDELFSAIRGKSKSEVEIVVSRYVTKSLPREIVKPISVVKKVEPILAAEPLFQVPKSEVDVPQPIESEPATPRLEELEDRVEIRFSLQCSSMDKLRRLQALMSHKAEAKSLEGMLELMVDELLEKRDPARKEIRAKSKAEPKAESVEAIQLGESGSESEDAGNPTGSRYIPVETRRAVFKRDDGCCSWVGANGKRCGSTWFLQYDHIHPYSCGGSNDPSNLQLLCGLHNRLAWRRFEEKSMKGDQSTFAGDGELQTGEGWGACGSY